MTLRRSDFGDDFTWGVASAAFQIEGAWDRDGKRPSVWDEAGRRGRIRGGAVGNNAIDAYDRYEEDLDLIAALGVNANRFSISWPRVFGDGRGPWNPKGGDFYDRLIDAGLERGLEPWVTVHHWDMPLALHREGGWTRRGIVEDFAAFAEELARRFGDRVDNWMVFNEPASVIGHTLIGIHGRYGPHPLAALASIHHMNLACAEAGRRMRAALPDTAQIGTTNVFTIAAPFDTTDAKLLRAQRAVEALAVGVFIDPAGGLGYPFDATPILRPMRRYIRDGDLESATFDYDFMGIQYYGPVPIRKAPIPGIGGIPQTTLRTAEANVRSSVGIPVEPEGLLEILRRYRDHPTCRRMVITESGFGMNDRLIDGEVHDDLRIWFARTHLEAVRTARREGIAVDGFFQWSYADNIEWVLGRDARFGLVYIDYDDDYRRYPKDSYRWFQRLLTAAPVAPVAPVAPPFSSSEWAERSSNTWLRLADRLEAQLEPVNEPLLDRAHLQPGERVLDIGCGRAATTRLVASIVGERGSVVGIDVGADVIAAAREIESGPTAAPIELVVADAQRHPFPPNTFDAAVSRFGVMFFDDPVAAFANIARAVRPNGRLCIAVWQPWTASTVHARSLEIAAGAAASLGVALELTPTDAGPFGFGDETFTVAMLEAAGWSDVTFTPSVVDLYVSGPGATADQAVDTAMQIGLLKAATSGLDANAVDAIRTAVRDDFAARHDGVGIRSEGAIAIVTARRG